MSADPALRLNTASTATTKLYLEVAKLAETARATFGTRYSGEPSDLSLTHKELVQHLEAAVEALHAASDALKEAVADRDLLRSLRASVVSSTP
jgi:hypothetical protein